MAMNFTTKGKTYGDSSSSGLGGTRTTNQDYTSNLIYEKLSLQNTTQERPGVQARIFGNLNDEAMDAFPNLRINRVSSKEYKERLEKQQRFNAGYGYNQTLTNSLYAKPYTRDLRGNEKMSTSVDKTGGISYSNPRQAREGFSANQSDSHKPSYGGRYTYGSYKRDMSPRYANDKDSDGGSVEKQTPAYKRIQHLGITANMVSSVISRESVEKVGSYGDRLNAKPLSTSSRGKISDQAADEAYNLYSSRHPKQSIRKSTIQISKAISSNAITELQRQNEIQNKTIKKLQTQLQSIKASLQKWEDAKSRYQMDVQAKSRQIFDLQRANKRLSEEVQSLRTYRTMETVEQVIIAKLKEQIMHLNKKIIEMQAQYYKNQKLWLSKQNKDGKDGQNETQQSELAKKLEINFEAGKKQIELLNEELKKEKEKCWKLQRERQQYLAEKGIAKQDFERQLNNAKTDISILNQQVIKHIATIRTKQATIQELNKAHSVEIQKFIEKNKASEAEINRVKTELNKQIEARQKEDLSKKIQEQLTKKLQEQKESFDAQLSKQLKEKQEIYSQRIEEETHKFTNELNEKLIQKQQQYRTKLNEEMRKFESKIIEQGKQQKLLESQISQKYEQEIRALRNKTDQDSNLIREIQTQIEMTKAILKQKNAQIEHLKVDNLKLIENSKKQATAEKQKWVKEEIAKIEHVVRLKIETEIKQRQRELEQKSNLVQAMQVKNQQMRLNLERQKQQATKIAMEAQKQLQEKANASSKQLQEKCKELETKHNTLTLQLSTLKAEKMKFQQSSRQAEIQLKRATDNLNIWKMKVENSSSLENQRDQLRAKVRQLQADKGNKSQLLTKYDELMAEHQALKEKLKNKEQQYKKSQAIYSKIKSYYDTEQMRMGGMSKQIRQLQAKVSETQSKFKSLLTKVELEQFKYKELSDKLIADSQTYMVYIKKLQQENELVYQKYLKVRKLCRANRIKIEDDNDAHQKVDYSTFRQYLEKQIYTQFTKMIVPAFESKICQKLASYDTNLTQKYKKLVQIKVLAERLKKRKQAQLTK